MSDVPPTPAAPPPRRGFLAEMTEFLRENRNWWLIPILVVLLLVGVVLVLSTTAAGPFIYTLF